MELCPSDIRYSVEAISPYFDAKGSYWDKTVHDLLEDILQNRTVQIPKIKVNRINRCWVTEDNHRLWVFRCLEQRGVCRKIHVNRAYFNGQNGEKSYQEVRLEFRKPEDRIQNCLDQQKKLEEEMEKAKKEKIREQRKKKRLHQKGKKWHKNKNKRKGKSGRRQNPRQKQKSKDEQQTIGAAKATEENKEPLTNDGDTDEEFNAVEIVNEPDDGFLKSSKEEEDMEQEESFKECNEVDDGDIDEDKYDDNDDDDDSDEDEDNGDEYVSLMKKFKERLQNYLQEIFAPNVGNFGSMILSIVLGLWLFNNLEKSGLFRSRD